MHRTTKRRYRNNATISTHNEAPRYVASKLRPFVAKVFLQLLVALISATSAEEAKHLTASINEHPRTKATDEVQAQPKIEVMRSFVNSTLCPLSSSTPNNTPEVDVFDYLLDHFKGHVSIQDMRDLADQLTQHGTTHWVERPTATGQRFKVNLP